MREDCGFSALFKRSTERTLSSNEMDQNGEQNTAMSGNKNNNNNNKKKKRKHSFDSMFSIGKLNITRIRLT